MVDLITKLSCHLVPLQFLCGTEAKTWCVILEVTKKSRARYSFVSVTTEGDCTCIMHFRIAEMEILVPLCSTPIVQTYHCDSFLVQLRLI